MSQETETTNQVFDFYSEYKSYFRVYVKSCGLLLCFQDEGKRGAPKIALYACTDEGEPSYPINIPHNSILNLEGCNYLKQEITEAFERGDYFVKEEN